MLCRRLAEKEPGGASAPHALERVSAFVGGALCVLMPDQITVPSDVACGPAVQHPATVDPLVFILGFYPWVDRIQHTPRPLHEVALDLTVHGRDVRTVRNDQAACVAAATKSTFSDLLNGVPDLSANVRRPSVLGRTARPAPGGIALARCLLGGSELSHSAFVE